LVTWQLAPHFFGGNKMLVLGIDTETTGLDTAHDEITEIGAVLLETATATPLRMVSTMVWHEAQKPLTPDLEALTGMTNVILADYGCHPQAALAELVAIMETPGLVAVVAHNGTTFDKPLLEAQAKRWGVELPSLPWIDTSVDVEYPKTMQTRKLTHLAAEHGFVNPFPHRAVFDVLTMLTILSRYDVAAVLEMSKQPSITLRAMTEKPWEDGGKSTDAAKARGYRWNGETKMWLRVVKAPHVAREIESAPFQVVELGVFNAGGAAL
jgi:DNA polymerase-3 subunit epsilon